MRFAVAVWLMLASAWLCDAAERERGLAVGGLSRIYTLITPDRQNVPLPLLIVFHGGGQTAERARVYTRFDRAAEGEKFVVVYPQGLGNNWNDGRTVSGLTAREASSANDVEFTAQIIAQLVFERVADSGRVFLAGASNGGMMALYAGCALEGRVAGIAAVVANQPADWRCRASRMPAIFIHGTDDEYMPFAGGQIAAKQSRRDLGRVLGVDETIALYRQMNSCAGVKESKRLDNDKRDGTIAVVTGYECAEAALKHIVIEGGGHTWPGTRSGMIAERVLGRTSNEINATAEIWQFFKSLPER